MSNIIRNFVLTLGGPVISRAGGNTPWSLIRGSLSFFKKEIYLFYHIDLVFYFK